MSDQPDQPAPYHHGDLRGQLMAAAELHIAQSGTEKLSLRALARDIGVSATAPYRHFSTRNHLFGEIATEGFGELQRSIERATADLQGDVRTALSAGGRAYVDYAVAHPGKYHLMFGGVLGDFRESEGLGEAAEASFSSVVRILEIGVGNGTFRNVPMAELAGTVWAAVHGVASLMINKGSLSPSGQPPTSSMAMLALSSIANDVDGVLDRLVFDGIINRERDSS